MSDAVDMSADERVPPRLQRRIAEAVEAVKELDCHVERVMREAHEAKRDYDQLDSISGPDGDFDRELAAHVGMEELSNRILMIHHRLDPQGMPDRVLDPAGVAAALGLDGFGIEPDWGYWKRP